MARLLELPGGGWVVDTPGVRAIGLVDLAARDAAVHFPELAEPSARCPWADCLHLEEEGCAVREAAGSEQLSDARYRSYSRLMVSLLEES